MTKVKEKLKELQKNQNCLDIDTYVIVNRVNLVTIVTNLVTSKTKTKGFFRSKTKLCL